MQSAWKIELDIRAIKITMGRDILRCKTPQVLRKEMWTCLPAYNLIRQTMRQSAPESGHSRRRLLRFANGKKPVRVFPNDQTRFSDGCGEGERGYDGSKLPICRPVIGSWTRLHSGTVNPILVI